MVPAIMLAQVSDEAGQAALDAAIQAATALAQGGSVVWKIVLIVLTLVGAPLAALAIFYINKLMKKTGIEFGETLQIMVRSQADRVIDQVEAWANKKAKEGSKQDSKSKLAKGLALLTAVLESTGADKMVSSKLEHILEERLMARNIVKTEGSSSDPS